jgi:hypothetical protein
VTKYEKFKEIIAGELGDTYRAASPQAAELIALLEKDVDYSAALLTLAALFTAIGGAASLTLYEQQVIKLWALIKLLDTQIEEPAA